MWYSVPLKPRAIILWLLVKTLYLLCIELDTLRKFWGGWCRFSLVKTLYLLCKELDWCLCFEAVRDSVWLKPYICSVKNSILAVTLVAKRTDICINWKLTRGEFSKKRQKQLSPLAFQVLACRETTFNNWNFSCKLPIMSLCLMGFIITNSVTADVLFTKN